VRLRPEQLEGHLRRGLAPVYVVGGEEPLQVEECLRALRAAAREAGFTERVVLDAEPGFAWGALAAEAASLSLFAERRLLELRIPGARPDEPGARALIAYCQAPPAERVLLVRLGKHDGRQLRSRWYRALEEAGAAVQAWPLAAGRLAAWVRERARGAGLALAEDAAELLAERSEGNLLALAQEIEKLVLLHPGAPVGVEEVLAAAADNARFGPFDLLDAVLAGDAPRALRIVTTLREEGLDPPQVLGALAWGLRAVAALASAAPRGRGLERVLAEPRYGVWRRRKALLARALQRAPATLWQAVVADLAGVERLAKGLPARPGEAAPRGPAPGWDGLARLALRACARPLAIGGDSL